MHKSKLLSSWLTIVIAVAALVSGTASAEAGKVSASVANGKIIYNEGKGDAAACMACHGEKALGMYAMGSPRLANIGYVYLVKQLTDFAADKRVAQGAGEVMNGFARALSEQDRRDVAAYVDTLEAASEPSDLKALAAEGQQVGKTHLGKILAVTGVAGKAAACNSCHGIQGRGADPMFPAIGQQKYVYLVNQLKSWRDGSRTNDPLVGGVGMMRVVAKNLTDDDIINVAAYLSSVPKVMVQGGLVLNNQTVLKHVIVQ